MFLLPRLGRDSGKCFGFFPPFVRVGAHGMLASSIVFFNQIGEHAFLEENVSERQMDDKSTIPDRDSIFWINRVGVITSI